mmetsp:Transcript_18953/g.32401  ORF Transcript_18953/g.32401 Transcript_18953/m.32401 type:complete len:113 (-) Transcript_18953:645-983(-)
MAPDVDPNGLKLPLVRVNKVLQASTPDASISVEGAAVLAKATELFLESFMERITPDASTAVGTKKSAVTYDAVATGLRAWENCDFAHDAVPLRVTGAEAKVIAAQHASAPPG